MKYISTLILPIIFILASCFSCKNAKPVSSTLHYEIREPKTTLDNAPLLILLHGYGSNEKDMFSLSQYMPEDFYVVTPRAPQKLSENKYAWYTLTPPLLYKMSEVQTAIEEIKTFTEYVAEKYKVDKSRIYLGGFSQGAILSMGSGLIHPDTYKGILCLSGQVYPEFIDMAHQTNQDLDIFISHGYKDETLLASDMRQSLGKLTSMGYDPDFHFYDTRHTISDQNLRDMIAWLATQLE